MFDLYFVEINPSHFTYSLHYLLCMCMCFLLLSRFTRPVALCYGLYSPGVFPCQTMHVRNKHTPGPVPQRLIKQRGTFTHTHPRTPGRTPPTNRRVGDGRVGKEVELVQETSWLEDELVGKSIA